LVLKKLIQDRVVPLVLDADALTILSEEPTWKAFLPPETILTPHPKEFDRLEGSTATSGYQRLQCARQMAMATGVVLVLKGAWTATCSPSGEVFFNSTGNPGMAKGGTGDALTGLVTGLLAQGHAPLGAALLGVFLHGLAGDLAALHKGMDGMTAGDLVEALPEAWRYLRNAGFDGGGQGAD
jgi:NAD(P)H-hydrate epimerase